MKESIISSFLAIACFSFGNGQNLVTNGDFSTKEYGCPTSTGFDSGKPLAWDDTTHPNQHSPDYFHPCGTSYSPGSNVRGCGDPLSGTAYVGVEVHRSNLPHKNAEYIHQELSSALTANQEYYIEFYVSAADDEEYNIWVKKLGMFLSTTTSSYSPPQGGIGFHHLETQVQIPNAWPSSAITNTSGWHKISGTYTPTISGIRHILIGYFDEDVNSGNPQFTYRSSQPVDAGFYFIDAVSITPSSSPAPIPGPQLSGPDFVCYGSNSTFSLTNYPPGANVSWQVSPSSLVSPSSGNGNTATFQASNSFTRGSTTLTFTINGECDSQIKQIVFWTGKPNNLTGSLSGPSSVLTSHIYWYSVPNQSQVDGSFDWTSPLGFLQTAKGDGYNSVQIWVQSYAQNGYVQVWKTNTCGNGGAKWKYVTVSGGGCTGVCEMQMSPNPARNSVDLQHLGVSGDPLKTMQFDSAFTYVIKSFDGEVLLSNESRLTRLTLDLSGIQEKGVYVLEVSDGYGNSRQMRLVIEK